MFPKIHNAKYCLVELHQIEYEKVFVSENRKKIGT
jgi:hypothetical protein